MPMRVFLSYSRADQSLATRLRRRLEEEGVAFNDPSGDPDACWRPQIEKAIRSCDAVLLLLSSRQKADEPQQLTWRLALEAVWADPTKPLIPILLHDAELPAFVRSGASGDSAQAIRIREPKDLGPAVQAILRTLGVNPPEEARGSLREGWLYDGNGAKSGRIIENYPAVTDEDRVQRRERLSAIRNYAEQLKH